MHIFHYVSHIITIQQKLNTRAQTRSHTCTHTYFQKNVYSK